MAAWRVLESCAFALAFTYGPVFLLLGRTGREFHTTISYVVRFPTFVEIRGQDIWTANDELQPQKTSIPIMSPLLLQLDYWDTLSFDLPDTVSFISKFKVIHLQIMKTGHSSI